MRIAVKQTFFLTLADAKFSHPLRGKNCRSATNV
jgi:hypothetical protein